LRKILSKTASLAIDTNVFVYFLTADSAFHEKASRLFSEIQKRNIKIITSNITIAEILSLQAPPSKIKLLENELFSTPNLTIIELSNKLAIDAAGIRRKHKFSLPDSIQLATASVYKAQAFVTNDQRLKKFKKLPIILLTSLSETPAAGEKE